MNQLTTVSGAEVISSRMDVIDSKSGVIHIELDPKLLPLDTIQSELSVETIYAGVSTYQSIAVQYTHRTIVIPKIPIMEKQGNEYRCQFVLRSTGLTTALANKEELQAFAIEGDDSKVSNKSKLLLKAEATPNTTGSYLNKVSISLQSSSESKERIPKRILLQCGDWKYEFDCQNNP